MSECESDYLVRNLRLQSEIEVYKNIINELKIDSARYNWLKNMAESEHENLSPTIPTLYCPSWKFTEFGWDEKIDKLIDIEIAKLY